MRFKEKFYSFVLQRPRLYDTARSIKRRIIRFDDPKYHFFNLFSAAHQGDVCFIQIGANDGLRHDPIREFILRDRWHGVLVEPLPGIFDKLKRNYSAYPDLDLSFVNAAISSELADEVHFWTFTQKFLSRFSSEKQLYYLRKASFSKEHVEQQLPDEYRNAANLERIRIRTLTINQLAQEYLRNDPANLVVIDAEGHESEIIPTIDFHALNPEAVYYESHNLREERATIEDFLKDKGYTIRNIGGDTVAVRNSHSSILSLPKNPLTDVR